VNEIESRTEGQVESVSLHEGRAGTPRPAKTHKRFFQHRFTRVNDRQVAPEQRRDSSAQSSRSGSDLQHSPRLEIADDPLQDFELSVVQKGSQRLVKPLLDVRPRDLFVAIGVSN